MITTPFFHGWIPRAEHSLTRLYCALVFLVILQGYTDHSLSYLDAHMDMVTPWLILACATSSPLRSFCLFATAGILIETHCTAPRGSYLYLYALLGSLIHWVKPHVSWNNTLTIPVFTFGGTTLVFIGETALRWTISDNSILWWNTPLDLAIRYLIAGLMLSLKFTQPPQTLIKGHSG